MSYKDAAGTTRRTGSKQEVSDREWSNPSSSKRRFPIKASPLHYLQIHEINQPNFNIESDPHKVAMVIALEIRN